MSETFRPGEASEVEEVARLVAHSFPGPGRTHASWLDYLTTGPHGGIEALWVAEEGGRLVGACQLLRLRQWIAGPSLPVMGLACVATSPTHRKRGLAARMISAGFTHARARGDVASALYPFRIAFYQGLGYGLAGEAHQYQVPPGSFPDDLAERLRVRLVATPEDEAAMRSVYDRAAHTFMTGQLDRSERNWRKSWGDADQAAVVHYGEEGEPEGYCIVRYRADLPGDKRFLEVEERAWLTDAARRGIYAWLSTLGDQWREIAYRAHPDEGFGDRIQEARLPIQAAPFWRLWFPAATLMCGPMFRLLDVSAAVTRRPLAADVRSTLRLTVDDAQVPENRGPWRVRLEGGLMEVRPDTGGACDAELAMPVETLSRVFIGALKLSQAVALGLATVDRAEALASLDLALEVPKPWTFDRF